MKLRLTIAILLVAVLPSVALGAVGVASGAIPFQPEVDYLANKNIAYWFLALAAIAIASWSFIVRWLLNQLESQRTVNADVTNKLIGYMEGDHAKMIAVTEKVLLVMDKVLLVMDKVLLVMDKVLERLDRRPIA